MTRKELETLGLEKEAIDTIMDLNGKAINKANAERDEALATVETLNSEIEKRATDFAELKAKAEDSTELKTQLEALTSDYDTYKEETSKREQEIKVNSALKLALAKSGTIDEVSLKANLNLEEVELLEDGTLKGIDEQLTALREQKAFLFGKDLNGGLPHGKPAQKQTDEDKIKEAMGFK